MRIDKGVAIPQIEIGDTAPDFIMGLVGMNPQLRSLSFTIYAPEPGVTERLANSEDRSVAEIVSNFLHHDNRPNEHWQVLVSDLTHEILTAKIASLRTYLALALDSKCTLHDGSLKYIPMMDFKPPPTANNLELLTEFLKRLACKGVIMDSGASYHFYGFDFFDYAQWREFMGKCLLAPWPDSRWIGHSLIADGGDLRISATELRQKAPSVCAILR
jgi:hypothetical protein